MLALLALFLAILVGSLVFMLLYPQDKSLLLEQRVERTHQRFKLKRYLEHLSLDKYLKTLDIKLQAVGYLKIFLIEIKSGIDFLIFRFSLSVLTMMVVFLSQPLSLPRGVISTGVGLLMWLLPNQVLKRKLHQRRERILSELPNIIEILVIAMESGLTFDSALRYLITHHRGLVKNLFAEANLKIEAGMKRERAFKEMIDSSQSQEVQIFIRTILQAEKQGRPIKQVLLDMAQAMRLRQRYEIRAKANRLPTTMLIPIFIFIVPPILLLYTLPALANLKYLF